MLPFCLSCAVTLLSLVSWLCYHLKAGTVVLLALPFVLRTDLAGQFFAFTQGFFFHFFKEFHGNFDAHCNELIDNFW